MLAVATALGGCGSARTPAPPPSARLVSQPGSHTREIVLTPLGAQRIGLVTTAVRRPAPAPGGVLVPASAIVYDPTGRTLIFTSPSPLHYLERPVQVARFLGPLVMLDRGPGPGARVVSVGAEELFGVQSGVLAQT
jgi:multidrug efflux pump subunit AcrA (membrane-fusion protein)